MDLIAALSDVFQSQASDCTLLLFSASFALVKKENFLIFKK